MRKYFLWAILVIAAMMLCGCDDPVDPTPAPTVAPMEKPVVPPIEHGNIYVNDTHGDDNSGNGTSESPFKSLMRAAASVKSEDYAGHRYVDVYINEDQGKYDFYDTWDSTAPILIHPLDEGEGCEWVMICVVGTDSSISDAYEAFRVSGCREGYLYTLTEKGGWEYKETWGTGGPLYHPYQPAKGES